MGALRVGPKASIMMWAPQGVPLAGALRVLNGLDKKDKVCLSQYRLGGFHNVGF